MGLLHRGTTDNQATLVFVVDGGSPVHGCLAASLTSTRCLKCLLPFQLWQPTMSSDNHIFPLFRGKLLLVENCCPDPIINTSAPSTILFEALYPLTDHLWSFQNISSKTLLLLNPSATLKPTIHQSCSRFTVSSIPHLYQGSWSQTEKAHDPTDWVSP